MARALQGDGYKSCGMEMTAVSGRPPPTQGVTTRKVDGLCPYNHRENQDTELVSGYELSTDHSFLTPPNVFMPFPSAARNPSPVDVPPPPPHPGDGGRR